MKIKISFKKITNAAKLIDLTEGLFDIYAENNLTSFLLIPDTAIGDEILKNNSFIKSLHSDTTNMLSISKRNKSA